MSVVKGAARVKAYAYRVASSCAKRNAALHFRLADARAKLDSWPSAVSSYKLALALDARPAVWHFALGAAFEKLGEWEEAARAYTAALGRDNANPVWHLRLGVVRARLGDWKGAAMAFRSAIERNPDNAAWHGRLGAACSKLHDWTGAANAYEAAAKLNPDAPAWHGRLGVARARLDDLTGAAAAFEAAIARDPNDATCHERLGNVLAKTGNWAGAVAAFEAAAVLSPEKAALHSRLGWAQDRWGELASALKAHEKALALDAANPIFHRRHGDTFAKCEDWPNAVKSYRAALNAKPTDDLVRYKLAFSLARCGRHKAAYRSMGSWIEKIEPLLDSFISGFPDAGEAGGASDAEILFVPGGDTILARKISVPRAAGEDIHFFEHTRTPSEGARSIADFYESLGQTSDEPLSTLTPQLHHQYVNDRFVYFLYEFIPNAISERGENQLRLLGDERLGRRIVDTLVLVANTQIAVPPGGASDPHNQSGILAKIPKRVVNHVLPHTSDPGRRSALEKLVSDWDSHRARFEALPQVKAHRNLHDQNIVLSDEGDIQIIDWETFGQAPVGYDLVTLFRETLEDDRFDALATRYFEALFPQMPKDEWGYILAMLVLHRMASRRRAPSQKWLSRLLDA